MLKHVRHVCRPSQVHSLWAAVYGSQCVSAVTSHLLQTPTFIFLCWAHSSSHSVRIGLHILFWSGHEGSQEKATQVRPGLPYHDPLAMGISPQGWVHPKPRQLHPTMKVNEKVTEGTSLDYSTMEPPRKKPTWDQNAPSGPQTSVSEAGSVPGEL